MITTELNGRTVLRFAIGGTQTQEQHIRVTWELMSTVQMQSRRWSEESVGNARRNASCACL